MPGQISWVELPAADTAKARTFYGSLFGWATNEFGGDYHVIDDGPAGAIAPREDCFTHPRVYFATEDIDATLAKIREAGGSADDKQPIPTVGWFARCKDTEGNSFSLFQSDESVPMPEGQG